MTVENGFPIRHYKNWELKQQPLCSAIDKAIIVGENSGEPVAFDNEKFKSRMKKKSNLDAWGKTITQSNY